MLCLDSIVSQIYDEAGFDEAHPPQPLSILHRLKIRVVRVRSLPVSAVYSARDGVILVRSSLSMGAVRFLLAHETAEAYVYDYRESDREQVCNGIAARLLAPRPAVRLAMRETDGSIQALAQYFCVSETIMALRRGEVVSPLALVTPDRVFVRGENYEWPNEHELRLVAAGHREAPVVRVVLTDARGRVALIAA